MDENKKPASTSTPRPSSPANPTATCQVCGKVGGVIYDPEKAPPNRLCYRCAAEYGMQDSEEE